MSDRMTFECAARVRDLRAEAQGSVVAELRLGGDAARAEGLLVADFAVENGDVCADPDYS